VILFFCTFSARTVYTLWFCSYVHDLHIAFLTVLFCSYAHALHIPFASLSFILSCVWSPYSVYSVQLLSAAGVLMLPTERVCEFVHHVSCLCFERNVCSFLCLHLFYVSSCSCFCRDLFDCICSTQFQLLLDSQITHCAPPCNKTSQNNSQHASHVISWHMYLVWSSLSAIAFLPKEQSLRYKTFHTRHASWESVLNM
jgi:hypothetical protein